jgi:hypothetical protein
MEKASNLPYYLKFVMSSVVTTAAKEAWKTRSHKYFWMHELMEEEGGIDTSC